MVFKLNNRRGNIPVVILVLLVFLVTASSLFVFSTTSIKIKEGIGDVVILEKSYLEENILESSLFEFSRNSLLKTYEDFASSGKYISGGVVSNLDGVIHFDSLNPSWEDAFLEDFEINLEKQVEGDVSNEEYDSFYDDGKIEVILSGIEFSGDPEFFSYIYSPKIFTSLNFNKIGLHDFEDIYDAKQSCKYEENFDFCLETYLFNFESFSEKLDDKPRVVHLISKKKFFIDGSLKNIFVDFVLK